MAGRRQPTDVVVGSGKKHLTRAEEDARRDREVHVPPPDQAEPPRWLPKRLHGEFQQIGTVLLRAGLFSELDRDVLGQYFLTRERWLKADKLAAAAIKDKDEKLAKEWNGVQSAYFRQARQCAEAMGLSASSRCRLVLPPMLASADYGTDDEFTARLRQRQAKAAGA